MRATLHTQTAAVSRLAPGRAWPALLTLLPLACVMLPAPMDAAEPVTTPAPSTVALASPVTPPSTAAPTVPAAAGRVGPLCDTDWDDGQALQPFNPHDPMYPYELRGGRYLFGIEGMSYKMVGRFDDEQEGEAALKIAEARFLDARTLLTSMGPYLVTESPTCKVTQRTRMNLVIDSASWILEKESVLLAGTQPACVNGTLTKKVTVISCDGMKNLMTDTVKQVCDRLRHVDTCVYTLEPGILLLKHKYTIEGATDVYDVRKKKRLHNQEESYGPGLPGLSPYNTEPKTDVEDLDQDGIPEIVSSQPRTGQRLSVRKWRKGKFIETRSP